MLVCLKSSNIERNFHCGQLSAIKPQHLHDIV